MKNGRASMENSTEISQKKNQKTELLYDLAILLPCIYPEKLKIKTLN